VGIILYVTGWLVETRFVRLSTIEVDIEFTTVSPLMFKDGFADQTKELGVEDVIL
jgi:hypothetical protein